MCTTAWSWRDSGTCKSLDPRALEEPRRAVLVVPVLLCGQVPAVVDVIVLLLDLQAVKVCRRDGAHGVLAWRKHIQPAVSRDQRERERETLVSQVSLFCFKSVANCSSPVLIIKCHYHLVGRSISKSNISLYCNQLVTGGKAVQTCWIS